MDAPLDRHAFEALLERILTSPPFAQSGRVRSLLSFLIRQVLEGKENEIKESVIANEVFGRSSYDPKADSLVRVTTSTLRSKLLEYYAGPGKDETIVVEIPKGAYRPVIRDTKPAVAERRDRRWMIRAGAVAGAAAIGSVFIHRYWPGARPRERIVVLPFVNLSGEPALDNFCDGLTEELIDRLSRQSGFEVIARTSSFQYKGKARDVREIGRQLQATRTVEGSKRRATGLLRTAAQPNRTDSGVHIWSWMYETRLNELFATQDRIVSAIDRSLNAPPQATAVRSSRSENLDAWEHLAKARAQIAQNATRSALQELETAITLDPGYAEAHAQLSRCLLNLITSGGGWSDGAVEKAHYHATQSIRLDPGLAIGHITLGRWLIHFRWDWAAGEKALRRAHQLEPSSAMSLTNLGVVLADRARPEAIQLLDSAVRLDPLYWSSRQHLGRALYLNRRYNDAVRCAREGLTGYRDIMPLWSRNYMVLSLAEGARGNHNAAIEAASNGLGTKATKGTSGGLLYWDMLAQSQASVAGQSTVSDSSCE